METNDEFFEMFSNGESEHVRFGVAAFTFTDNDDAEIYFHCQVIK